MRTTRCFSPAPPSALLRTFFAVVESQNPIVEAPRSTANGPFARRPCARGQRARESFDSCLAEHLLLSPVTLSRSCSRLERKLPVRECVSGCGVPWNVRIDYSTPLGGSRRSTLLPVNTSGKVSPPLLDTAKRAVTNIVLAPYARGCLPCARH